MNKDDFFKNLNGRKLFEGKLDQIKEWSEALLVRKDAMGYYISWKDRPGMVTGTHNFEQWSDAKFYLESNWRRLIDEEFERQVLIGSEGNTADSDSKNSSST